VKQLQPSLFRVAPLGLRCETARGAHIRDLDFLSQPLARRSAERAI
jgi:hypothetical protein